MNAMGDDAALARRIGDYLERQLGRKVAGGTIRRFPVGFSWLTYAVPITGLEDDGATRELRRVPGPHLNVQGRVVSNQ